MLAAFLLELEQLVLLRERARHLGALIRALHCLELLTRLLEDGRLLPEGGDRKRPASEPHLGVCQVGRRVFVQDRHVPRVEESDDALLIRLALEFRD